MVVNLETGSGGVRHGRGNVREMGEEMKGVEKESGKGREEAERHRVTNLIADNHHHVDSSDKTTTCLSLPVVRSPRGEEIPPDGTTTTEETTPMLPLRRRCLSVPRAAGTEAETESPARILHIVERNAMHRPSLSGRAVPNDHSMTYSHENQRTGKRNTNEAVNGTRNTRNHPRASIGNGMIRNRIRAVVVRIRMIQGNGGSAGNEGRRRRYGGIGLLRLKNDGNVARERRWWTMKMHGSSRIPNPPPPAPHRKCPSSVQHPTARPLAALRLPVRWRRWMKMTRKMLDRSFRLNSALVVLRRSNTIPKRTSPFTHSLRILADPCTVMPTCDREKVRQWQRSQPTDNVSPDEVKSA
jgi:hypothetical protein